MNGNIDYFRELLSERHLFQELNSEVRIGIARGMANSQFQGDLVPNVLEWYSHENSPSVTYYLLKYFQTNQHYSEQYHSIVDYQGRYGTNILQGLISANELQRHSLIGDTERRINMKVEIHAEHIGEIYNADGNQIIFKSFGTFSDSLKRELQQLKEVCEDNLKTDIDTAMNAIDEKMKINSKLY